MQGGFLVLDFGSQYTQLIVRRLRELGVYSELHAPDYGIEKIKEKKFDGIILSGGPGSVYDNSSPQRDLKELLKEAPLLGVCYGMQLLVKEFGGTVEASTHKEYGLNEIEWTEKIDEQVPEKQTVWMSHGDVVKLPPPGYKVIARSSSGHPAVIKGEKAWAFQFHPEVSHTQSGDELLKAFVFGLCQAKRDWTSQCMQTELTEQIRAAAGDKDHVLCALSGGVDSTVVGTLLTKALGPERVHCVFVDNGLLRKGEYEEVLATYKELGLNVLGMDCKKKFLSELKGVVDPERKRKTIGKLFIDVFKQAIQTIKSEEGVSIDFLAQGTLYPDVIESLSVVGQSVTIKSHHNVGGLPKDLNLKLIEPLRLLFKDEVRSLGEQLGIPAKALWRHPFPGPGLSIRIIGEVTEEDLVTLKDADAIFREELVKNDLYDDIWQAFAVLLPVRTVGVQGDNRTYQKTLALRAVTSKDGMTADWFDFPAAFLRKVSNRITNEVHSINRVVYDITSKPPGTIEWE